MIHVQDAFSTSWTVMSTMWLKIVTYQTILTFICTAIRSLIKRIKLRNTSRFCNIHFEEGPIQKYEKEGLDWYGINFPWWIEKEHELKEVCKVANDKSNRHKEHSDIESFHGLKGSKHRHGIFVTKVQIYFVRLIIVLIDQ